MFRPLVTILGKSVQSAARIKGSGTALPGLVVERIDSNYVKKSLEQLPMGIVVVSGTNGKTTTTKMIVELLEMNGVKVFTNRTGSNFSRGIAAALLEDVSLTGKLQADIAVLELDEAHAVNFVKTIKPTYSLLLNVMRDQLDRFGEIDKTAELLQKIAENTTSSVILNREDPLVAAIADDLNAVVRFYGLSSGLRRLFPSDRELHGETIAPKPETKAEVVVENTNLNRATFTVDGKNFDAKLSLNGLYNIFNAAGAMTLVREILKDIPSEKLISDLEKIKPAFGRGEMLSYNGKNIELVLVKNPSGFRLGIESFDQTNFSTMIVINDDYADGRDMSWLWDVDFLKLKNKNYKVISGTRAYDMGLRLKYDEIDFNLIDADIDKALKIFLDNELSDKRIYCTYTAMLQIRKKLTKNKRIGEV